MPFTRTRRQCGNHRGLPIPFSGRCLQIRAPLDKDGVTGTQYKWYFLGNVSNIDRDAIAEPRILHQQIITTTGNTKIGVRSVPVNIWFLLQDSTTRQLLSEHLSQQDILFSVATSQTQSQAVGLYGHLARNSGGATYNLDVIRRGPRQDLRDVTQHMTQTLTSAWQRTRCRQCVCRQGDDGAGYSQCSAVPDSCWFQEINWLIIALNKGLWSGTQLVITRATVCSNVRHCHGVRRDRKQVFTCLQLIYFANYILFQQLSCSHFYWFSASASMNIFKRTKGGCMSWPTAFRFRLHNFCESPWKMSHTTEYKSN